MSFIEPLFRLLAGHLDRIRRNHGLEHATIHILSQRFPGVFLAGHSDTQGFWLIGQVPLEAVTQAAQEALERLRRGERHLALHPGCGTNYLTSGAMTGLAGMLALSGARSRRDKWDRLPLVVLSATLALIFSQPVGMWLQERLTTSGDPGALEIVEVIASRRGQLPAYRVITRG